MEFTDSSVIVTSRGKFHIETIEPSQDNIPATLTDTAFDTDPEEANAPETE
jgi:hypothetical protein